MPAKASWLKRHLGEVITVTVLFFLLLGGTLTYALFPREIATYADVTLRGKFVERMAMDVDKKCVVNTEKGEVVVEVYKKEIYFVSSPCPNQTCIREGHKTKAGETLVCAHTGVVITLLGGPVEEIIL